MSVLEKVKLNISDAALLGPQFLLRHIARLNGSEPCAVEIAGHGVVHVRKGDSDLHVVRQVFKEKQYELGASLKMRATQRYTDILRCGQVPTIVDAGANIGAASIWFKNTYPDAHVIAVEPEPENLSMLRKNAGHRISVREAAIGSSSGFVSVKNEGLGWAAQTQRSETGIAVVTMSELFAEGNSKPFIVKVDIEGFESDLFSKNLQWLDEVFLVYIEPHDWLLPGQGTSRTFQRAMGDRDFEILISGENLVYVRP